MQLYIIVTACIFAILSKVSFSVRREKQYGKYYLGYAMAFALLAAWGFYLAFNL